MAILHYCQCQVLVNGVPAQEYDHDDEAAGPQQPGTVTQYIEAVSGAEFSIRVSSLPAWTWSNDLVWGIFLDGRTSEGRVVIKRSPSSALPFWVSEGEYSGSGTDWVLRKFKFADIVTGDLPVHMSAPEIKARYSSLGQIRVEIYRFEATACEPRKPSSRYYEAKETSIIPEKALKGQALNLTTSLGEAKKSSGGQSCDGRFIDKKPLESFVFLYRSKQALQQLMIIPRSPTPIPLEERPIDELSVEEARELLRRRAEGDAVVEIKSEATRHVKRERNSPVGYERSRKIARRMGEKEYIDLVDDSKDDQKKGVVYAGEGIKKMRTKVEVVDLLD